MSEDCCATGCDVREGSCFQSSEKRPQWPVANNFLRIFLKNHQTRPTFIKFTCSVRASRENKSFSDVRADIFPSAFRTFPKIVFAIFMHFCFFFETLVWDSILSGFFQSHDEKVPRTVLNYPFNGQSLHFSLCLPDLWSLCPSLIFSSIHPHSVPRF